MAFSEISKTVMFRSWPAPESSHRTSQGQQKQRSQRKRRDPQMLGQGCAGCRARKHDSEQRQMARTGQRS